MIRPLAFAGILWPLLLAPALAATEKELSIEEFLQNLSTVQDVMTRKDPFIQAPPPFEIPRPDAGNLNAPVLERYPVGSYSVVAVLLGEQYPRALLRLPESEQSKVVIIKEKDKLGNKGGVVSKIIKEGLVITQNQRSPLGFVDKTEVRLKVGELNGKEAPKPVPK